MNIAIQGLGYVGLAMLTFCAGAKKNNKYLYNVVGVEKNSPKGKRIVEQINFKQIPKIVDDENFHNFFLKLIKDNRLKASTDELEYSKADIVFVCSNCDYDFNKKKVQLDSYIKNINQISKKINNNCLLIIQTTLPPGTTDKILKPLIEKNLKKRGIKNFYLCHSFERITPGKDYYNSMKSVERVIGGINNQSLKKAKKVLKDIFNLKNEKIVELDSLQVSQRHVKLLRIAIEQPILLLLKNGENFAQKIIFI